jgi:DNA-binding GntR family transcriptional regulator
MDYSIGANKSMDENAFLQAHVERASLKDQVVSVLREMIVNGKIASGSKVTERDVAERLNISRMPARDALMELERQGLIVTKPGGRYVIELNEQDIRHLYQLRVALEKLAVELAIGNASPEKQHTLEEKLAEMRQAIAMGDSVTYTASDLQLHEFIWEQADNPYLLDMLHAMIGPIFMFIASQSRMIEDWQESLQLHEQLVERIGSKDTLAAVQSIEAHIRHSLDLALVAFQK